MILAPPNVHGQIGDTETNGMLDIPYFTRNNVCQMMTKYMKALRIFYRIKINITHSRTRRFQSQSCI